METIVIPVWGLITVAVSGLIVFVGGWIKIKVDISKIDQKVNTLETIYATLPEIWEKINNVHETTIRLDEKMKTISHNRKNTEAAVSQILNMIKEIQLDLVKVKK